MLSQRLRNATLRERIVTAEEAASWIEDGMTLGFSGFTAAGDVKVIPLALVERVKNEGKPFKVNVYTGASISSHIDGILAESGIVHRRLPYQSEKRMRTALNKGDVCYMDQHLSHTAELLRSGAIPPVDVALIEAAAITEEGHIIPSTSVGNSHIFVAQAKEVIIELNVAQPLALEGVHDIYDPGYQGHRQPIPLTQVGQRVGTTAIPVDPAKIRGKLVLRPQEMSNNPGLIRRLGLIAINTALEVDIYGHVNSTHVMGTQMMNGIGGSGDFARNARLTFFCTKSYAKNGKISSIVPMCSHVDHTEHDVDIIVTEQGLADLRGLSPRERAKRIIENCAHPSYRPLLRAYYEEAVARGGHTPHVIEKALSFHARYVQTGSMLE
ncbi:acetyl-CoA hydrolase [Heliobacterium undosum]|uniref:Acetyl-CoA hydrolase n=1 Tax=Heliomicrobium undosum TaxID=121734 RepID=A0A845L227_9FIRM|nr:acetyl-CoA hydrolase/transferase C-terminal domain-containing protein [Heliomicrobium undosum]MZP30597.1 acetyl-CoA hydrolase [Heliomicrobium undosum]